MNTVVVAVVDCKRSTVTTTRQNFGAAVVENFPHPRTVAVDGDPSGQ